MKENPTQIEKATGMVVLTMRQKKHKTQHQKRALSGFYWVITCDNIHKVDRLIISDILAIWFCLMHLLLILSENMTPCSQHIRRFKNIYLAKLRISCLGKRFYPTAIRAVGVLFSTMVSGWVVSGKKFVPAVSQKLYGYRKLILGRDIEWRV